MKNLLHDILSKEEGKTLEFKRDLSSPKPILRTIVAFANTAGGSLVIGVADDRKIIGIDDPLSAEEKLTSLVADSIAPQLLLDIKFLSEGKKSVILIEVPHLIGPFYLKSEGAESGVMVRSGSSTRRATPELISQIKQQRSQQSFDQLPCHGATLKDLNKNLLKEIFKKIKQPLTESRLKTLGIIVEHGNKQFASNAGVILFGKENVRYKYFPDAYVRCARFAGKEKVDFIDQIDIDNILSAIEEAPKFIRRNTQVAYEISAMKRKEIPEYPPIAIREGLLNALMHADYSLRGARIFVSIFEDRLEIRNPGNFPLGMTIEDLKNGVSKIRNHVIARIFEEMGLVETWGSGYKRIYNTCEKGGYTLPEWREMGVYTDICFKSTIAEKVVDVNQGGTKLGLSRDQVGTKSGPSQTNIDLRQNLTDEQLIILSLCLEPSAITEMMLKIGWKNRTKFRNKFLTHLVKENLILQTIPDKPNSRLQKYKTTAKGSELLNSLNKHPIQRERNDNN